MKAMPSVKTVFQLASIGLATWLLFPILNTPIVANGQEPPSITISLLNEPNPLKWGVQVDAFGFITGSSVSDNVTISWGDGTDPESGIAISEGAWGLVSHTYDVTAAGQHDISVKLVNASGNEIASNSLTIEVAPTHFTFILFDPIPSVTQAENILVTGTLYDGDLSVPIPNIELQFGGSGGAGVPPATTDEFGFFNSTGPSPDLAEDALAIQASLSSDIYDDPLDLVTYDTISSTAVTYEVPEGQNVFVNLTDFSASVEFENVATAGTLLAYECNSPSNSRYTEESLLNSCLNIRPSLEMAEGSIAEVAMSLAGSDSAAVNVSDLRLFRVDGESAADITLRFDQDIDQIIGQTSSFSRFVIAIPDFPAPADHSRRVPIFLGVNTMEFRDVDSKANVSATFDIDDQRITIGQEVKISIADPDGNINPELVDSISAFVSSSSSSPDGITLELDETQEDSGLFEGTIDTTGGSTSGNRLHVESGDSIVVSYTQSSGRLGAVIEGVSEAGIAEMIDYTIDPTQVQFVPIGGAVELSLPGVQLDSEGKITVTMSYANAVFQGQIPPTFRLFHLDGGSWVDITLPDGVNEDALTVTGETTTLSPFTIGVFTGVPGGAGGGGFTGSGFVVDAVASIARSSSSSSGGGGGGGGSGAGSSTTGSSTTGSSLSSTAAQLPSGSNVEVVATVSPSSAVEFEFENVLTPGIIVVDERSLASMASSFSETTDTNGKVVLANGSEFTTVGSIFDIQPAIEVSYQGSIDITVPYSTNLLNAIAGSSSSDVRLLHYNGIEWEDATISIDENAGTVTGRVSSLSPVVATVVSDGTFGPRYFDVNPLGRIADTSTAGDSILILDENGMNLAASAPASKLSVGSTLTLANTIENMQREPQAYTYIVEVFDSSGVTVELIQQTGTLGWAQATNISTTWIGSEPGTYSFKIFVIEEGGDPAPQLLKNSAFAGTVEVTT